MFDMAKYICSSSPIFGQARNVGLLIYFFSLSKAFWYFFIHSKFLIFLSNLKNSKHLSADLDIQQFRIVILYVNLYTILTELGDCMSIIALIFSRFAYIPLCDTMKPKRLRTATTSTHYLRFNFTPNFLSTPNMSSKSFICSFTFTFFTTMSFT